MADTLTPMQRRILTAMRDNDLGYTAFLGEGARKLGFAVFEAKAGGIVIRAYQHPQYFLKQRGLIEQRQRNVPGSWYVLTAAGREAI